MKRSLLVMLLAVFIGLFSGCASSDEVYDGFSFFERPTRREMEAIGQGKMVLAYDKENFDNYFEYLKYCIGYWLDQISDVIKEYAVPVMVASFSLGALILCIARKSIQIRKFAFFVFILGIPTIVFVLVYGTAIIADMF